MKKFTKIISMICVLTFVLSLSVFAGFEDGTPVEFSLKADKDSYKVGEEITLTLYTDDMSGEETFGLAYIYSDFQADELEFVSDSTGSAKASEKDGNTWGLDIEHEEEFVANWDSVLTIKFKALKAGELTYVMNDVAFGDAEYNSTASETFPSITITVEEDALDTTITKGGKEYTSVPNKFFENVAVTGTTTGGTVTATYTGGTKTSYVFPFTFGGTILNGSGSVSFDVAIVGVPSNITVTDIAVSVN